MVKTDVQHILLPLISKFVDIMKIEVHRSAQTEDVSKISVKTVTCCQSPHLASVSRLRERQGKRDKRARIDLAIRTSHGALGKSREYPGKIGKSRENWNITGKSWENHGKITGKSWENHGKYTK